MFLLYVQEVFYTVSCLQKSGKNSWTPSTKKKVYQALDNHLWRSLPEGSWWWPEAACCTAVAAAGGNSWFSPSSIWLVDTDWIWFSAASSLVGSRLEVISLAEPDGSTAAEDWVGCWRDILTGCPWNGNPKKTFNYSQP